MLTLESLTYSAIVLLLAFKLFIEMTKGRVKSHVCMVGKTVLITGANSGLGYETAKALAARGAKIIIADVADCTESRKKIIEQTNNPNVVAKHLDLASFDSIRKFAEEINETETSLDVLINNAGVGGCPQVLTVDGLPLHMQINHLGHFLLTYLLLRLLKKSAPSRIIFVSSWMSYVNTLTGDSLTEKHQSPLFSYSNTKLCNLITSEVFAKKLNGSGVTSNAVHPGFVNTGIYEKTPIMKYYYWFIIFLAKIFGKTVVEGAQTHIHCALSKDLTNVTGKYFADCRRCIKPLSLRDEKFCMTIWRKSEELVKLKPDELL